MSEHLEPWPQVLAFWEYTHEARQKILKSLNDINTYYNKFPCLKQPLGYELVNIIASHKFALILVFQNYFIKKFILVKN